MSSSTDTADTATAETDIYTYQFESALDPTISDFFVNNTLPTWTWDNFESDYLEEEPKAVHNTFLQAYKDNMKKIIDNKDLKQEIKRKTGQIFRDLMTLYSQSKGKAEASNNIGSIDNNNNNKEGINNGSVTFHLTLMVAVLCK